MNKQRQYTQQSRDEILRSNTNQSTSKQAWTFSKQKRFILPLPNCPNVSYNTKMSTLMDRQASFGSLKRRVFTQVTPGPSSWLYSPYERYKTMTVSFGRGRDEVISNSYIMRDPLKNPGPGSYQLFQNAKHGYSMRPKTAHHRNYFIDDKQMQNVPGPGKYDDQNSKIVNRSLVSKFKSVILGGPMTNKQKRFLQRQQRTPSAWDYNNQSIYQKGRGPCCAKMGYAERRSFIDHVRNSSYTPGPGNYKLPTEFAHYKKMTPFL